MCAWFVTVALSLPLGVCLLPLVWMQMRYSLEATYRLTFSQYYTGQHESMGERLHSAMHGSITGISCSKISGRLLHESST